MGARVRPPVGGYVLMLASLGMFGIGGIYTAITMILGGQPLVGVVVLAISVPIAGFIAREALNDNREARRRREQLMVRNPKVAKRGVRRRWYAIGLMVIVGVLDLWVFGTALYAEIVLIAGLLACFSVVSVEISSLRNWWSGFRQSF